MLTEEQFQELVHLSDQEATMVSLYLNVDPSRHTKEEYRLTLRKLVKDVSATISAEDVTRIERYLDFEYDWQGKSLALFSSALRGIWRAYPLPVPIEDQIHVLNRPYIEPLSQIIDLSGHYAVALVAREGARLFLMRAGQIDDKVGTFGPLPARHKQGGWSASRIRRHSDEVAHRNMRDGVDLLVKFCEQAKCDRLLVAGTDQNVHLFETLLPKKWRDQVIGTFTIDINASESEVLERSLVVVQQLDPAREQRLVDEMITAAAKGGHGAVGLADTLGAIQSGRAMTLIVADGYQAEGFRCTQCGFTSAQPLETCSFCGGKVEHVADAVNGLIHKAMADGLRVEMVRNNLALVEAGSIGALLRY